MPTFINRIYFGLHDNIGVPPFLFPFNFSSFSFLFSSFFLSFLVLFLSSIFLSFFLLFSCSPFLFFPFFPPQFCPQDPNFADRSDYWGGVTPPPHPPSGNAPGGNSSIHVATTHRMTQRCGKLHTLFP